MLGYTDESAVYIAAHYGLRRSEVLGLKWDCINFEEKTISIKEVRVKYGKEVVVKKPKSESSQRTLPLMEKIEDYLKLLKKQRKKNKLLYGKDYIDSGLVCCWPDGNPMKTEYLNHKFKDILAKNGLPHIRFHDLRHSTASYLVKHGVSLKEVQVWLGHSTLNITANTYTHIDMDTKKDTAQKINALFSSSSMKYAVWRALDDAGITSALLDIVRAHVKLALEYSHKNTLPCRKESIRAEIQRLRMERDGILECISRHHESHD